jgi:hypothetical protein
MLPTTEPNLQPKLCRRRIETGSRIAGPRNIEAQTRQRNVQKSKLARTKRMPALAPVKTIRRRL